MSAEEDTELRDLIIHTLENNGVIGKIKAELRASVFLALEEEGTFREKIPLVNKKLTEFIATPDGKLVVSVVREFLDYFNLNFSLAVFDPEVSAPTQLLSKSEICSQLKLNDKVSSSVIAEVIKRTKAHNSVKEDDLYLNLAFNIDENRPRSGDIDDTTKSADSNFSSVTKIAFEQVQNTDSSKKAGDLLADSFFDEPLPQQDHSLFSLRKDDNQSKDVIKNINPVASMTESKVVDKSLTSLRDLPSLSVKSTDILYDWTRSTGKKKSLPSLGISLSGAVSSSVEVDYDDDSQSLTSGQSSKSSQRALEIGGEQTGKSDDGDNSEQSIEEEIEEDFSGGADELLSSISFVDDATSEQTVSQISIAGGYDYLESCDNAK